MPDQALPAVKAVFVDRDGVVNDNRQDHVKTWQEFRFRPDAISSLQKLRKSGVKLAVVTNQANIDRGVVTRATIDLIHSNMQNVLSADSAQFDTIQYCPHKPEALCECRKPKPGLIIAAAEALVVELAESCIVGDTYSDAMAGLSAGCSYAVLIPSTRDPGSHTELPEKFRNRVVKYSSFAEATNHILNGAGQTS